MYSVPRQNFAFAVDGLDKTTYTPNVLNQLRNDVVRHVLSAFDWSALSHGTGQRPSKEFLLKPMKPPVKL